MLQTKPKEAPELRANSLGVWAPVGVVLVLSPSPVDSDTNPDRQHQTELVSAVELLSYGDGVQVCGVRVRVQGRESVQFSFIPFV